MIGHIQKILCGGFIQTLAPPHMGGHYPQCRTDVTPVTQSAMWLAGCHYHPASHAQPLIRGAPSMASILARFSVRNRILPA